MDLNAKEHVMKELYNVFKLLSTIPVTHEHVDTMAAVRLRLQNLNNFVSNIEVVIEPSNSEE